MIGQRLNVRNFLEGSVRRDGSRVRITVQLINADDGFHVWSESYDRDFKDIFAVEDDIAKAVSSALQPRLLGRESSATPPASRTTNPEAYQAFLQARYFARQNDNESVQRALGYLNRAVQLDPDYAPAYALRGTVTAEAGFMGRYRSVQGNGGKPARRRKGNRVGSEPGSRLPCVERNPGAVRPWDWRGAERSVRKARELAPGDAYALWQSAFFAWCRGRLEDAAELTRQEHALDPAANQLFGIGTDIARPREV